MKITNIALNWNMGMNWLRIAAVLMLLSGRGAFSVEQPTADTARRAADKSCKELVLDCGNGIPMKLMAIPSGQFTMGSPETLVGPALLTKDYVVWENRKGPPPASELPQHRVRITEPFYMGIYTVTQAQYEALMGANPSRYKGANRPVEMVSWKDAVEFCKRLSEKSGRQIRLPTEAEWEYACRAGTTTPWYTGATFGEPMLSSQGDKPLAPPPPKQANYWGYWERVDSEVNHSTMPVGSYPPNPWGLYDMLGNVQQWCQDWYDRDYYKKSPVDDPTGPVGGNMRVARGGSWDGCSGDCRSARRMEGVDPALERDWTKGFRVVCVCTPEESKNAPQVGELEAYVKTLPLPPKIDPASAQTPPAMAGAETLAQRLDGSYYYITNSVSPTAGTKVPERFASEKRKVTVVTPKGNVEKDITYYKDSFGLQYVLVPSGEFLMGTAEEYFTGAAANTSCLEGLDPNDKCWKTGEAHRSPDKFGVPRQEKPQHKVRITKPFFMAAYTVTFEQYTSLMGPQKYYFRAAAQRFKMANPPVVGESWYDAAEFCRRLSAKLGREARLPTEAEWEYACRAGTTTHWYTGEKISYKQADVRADWVDFDGKEELPPKEAYTLCSHPKSVGSYPPNPWGLYDMIGNTWQWCQDWYDPDYYKKSPVDDPTGPSGPLDSFRKKAERGGGSDCWPGEARAAIRHEAREAQFMHYECGAIRVVCPCTPEEIEAAGMTAGAASK
jgi:formylglycine-generating enzyme required for sulfatase activity